MNKIIIPVLASILILGALVSGLTPSAYAAQGTITFVNPADKHGMITEDGTGDVYQFQIPQDLADSDYEPNVNDKVTFTEGPGQTASDVALAVTPVTIFFHHESGEGIPNAECSVSYFAPEGLVQLFGTTDVDGLVTITIPLASPDIHAVACLDELGNQSIICADLPGRFYDITIGDALCGGF